MSADPTLCPIPIKARNKPGYFIGQELEAAIRKIVDELVCPCCSRPPTAKDVLAELPEHLKRSPQRVNTLIRKIMAKPSRIGERSESLSGD